MGHVGVAIVLRLALASGKCEKLRFAGESPEVGKHWTDSSTAWKVSLSKMVKEFRVMDIKINWLQNPILFRCLRRLG